MDLRKFKKKLILKTAIYGGVIIFSSALYYYSGTVLESFNKKHSWLRSDISSLKEKLDSLTQKTLEFSEAIQTWERLNPEQQALQGLRINNAKDLLDNYTEIYKLSNMQTVFSKPEQVVDEELKSETVDTISSTVNLSFSALTDEYVFNFIGALVANFPGFVQIKTLSISRQAEVTKEQIGRIALGERPALVDVKMDFLWHDLKYNGPMKADHEGENPEGTENPENPEL